MGFYQFFYNCLTDRCGNLLYGALSMSNKVILSSSCGHSVHPWTVFWRAFVAALFRLMRTSTHSWSTVTDCLASSATVPADFRLSVSDKMSDRRFSDVFNSHFSVKCRVSLSMHSRMNVLTP